MDSSNSASLIEEKLHLLKAATNNVNAGMAIIDSQGSVCFWNQWLIEKSGLSCEAVSGKSFLELFPELENSRLALAINDALNRGLASLLSQTLHRNPLPLFNNPSSDTPMAAKERLQQAIHVTPLICKNNTRYCLVQVNDVSLAVKKERLLREQADALRGLAYLDGLTGVPNRRRLDEYLGDEFKRAIRSNTPLSIIMLDVDHFKQYNDTYNHSAGDFCLQRIANAIKATLRRPADLVARYGGEEFAIILPDTPVSAAIALAEDIRKQIENLAIPHETSEVTQHVTASMGVAGVLPDTKISAGELLIQADTALYQAKKKGRNRVTKYREPPKTS
jgi:diguanylate cyclase (GGDEF)-like protein